MTSSHFISFLKSPTSLISRYPSFSKTLVLNPCQFLHSNSNSNSNSNSDAWVESFSASQIPKTAYQTTFVKSSGPGGQHVNKCNSKVMLRLPLVPPPTWIPLYCVEALKALPNHFLTKSKDELIITSDKTRSQHQNLENCLFKLVKTIQAAGKLPKDPSLEQLQKIQRIKRINNEKRLETKQKRKDIKETRRIDRRDL